MYVDALDARCDVIDMFAEVGRDVVSVTRDARTATLSVMVLMILCLQQCLQIGDLGVEGQPGLVVRVSDAMCRNSHRIGDPICYAFDGLAMRLECLNDLIL